MSDNKTIFKNTVLLYARTIFLLVLGVFTSRVTMQALGVENYGIINVVGGFVSMFALISGALTGACQRFITYELGKPGGDVRQVFSSTFFIHLFLAVLITILAETFGLYFVNSKLNLPPEKMVEVQWVFHCSVISFILSLINIPYNALIIAHERLQAFAYLSIVEGLLKFGTVFCILKLPYNSLILYSCLTLLSSTILRLIIQIYCTHTFRSEAKVKRVSDKSYFISIFKFSGWAIIGNSATLLNNQGINMILNIFVGVTINAARGIASMVESVVLSFVNNFTMALNPQITKSYAASDKTRMLDLLDLGTRLSFSLMMCMSVPIIIVAPDLLQIWLTTYPDYAVIFLRLTLIISIVQAVANPYITAVCATGNIRNYQLTVGGLTLLNIPVCYALLKVGLDATSVYFASLIMYIATFAIRMMFVRNQIGLPIKELCKTIILKLIPIALISLAGCYFIAKLISTETFWGLFLFAILSCFVTMPLIFYVILKKNERNYAINYIKTKISNKND